MRILVIETATAACSVALIDDRQVVASDHATVGRGHAERLMPMIAGLPGGGRADAIRVDCGPGSFTGIRVGLAAARALGFGWGIPVAGYSSLALIAATWFDLNDAAAATVVIEGGHGEVFAQTFAQMPFAAVDDLRSLPVETATFSTSVLIGNAAHRFVAAPPGADAAPDARNVVLLDLPLLPPRPLYGRSADAKPMA
ncbi:MAG: tRNA (adenosine(37)-N6)-threonylcarbamoyltransferase complex dimerization subunit type 1 TsaB [Sphingomonadaceae bacterium]